MHARVARDMPTGLASINSVTLAVCGRACGKGVSEGGVSWGHTERAGRSRAARRRPLELELSEGRRVGASGVCGSTLVKAMSDPHRKFRR